MSELYNRIEGLCSQRKITITTMCRESGASRASLSDLKVGRKQSLSADTLSKIATFFGVSVDYLLGAPQDGSDIGVVLGIIQEEYGISYDETIKIQQTFTPEWCREKNVSGIFNCFRVYFAENGVYPKGKAPTSEGERPITFDDFTYAMQNEAKELTAMDKQILLSMAKQLNDARKKKDGESG